MHLGPLSYHEPSDGWGCGCLLAVLAVLAALFLIGVAVTAGRVLTGG